jgi:hypothetical protein
MMSDLLEKPACEQNSNLVPRLRRVTDKNPLLWGPLQYGQP